MANSESEDFESADEGTMQIREKNISDIGKLKSDVQDGKKVVWEKMNHPTSFQQEECSDSIIGAAPPDSAAGSSAASADAGAAGGAAVLAVGSAQPTQPEWNGARPKVYPANTENARKSSGKRFTRNRPNGTNVPPVLNRNEEGNSEEKATGTKVRKEPKKLGAIKLGTRIPSITVSASTDSGDVYDENDIRELINTYSTRNNKGKSGAGSKGKANKAVCGITSKGKRNQSDNELESKGSASQIDFISNQDMRDMEDSDAVSSEDGVMAQNDNATGLTFGDLGDEIDDDNLVDRLAGFDLDFGDNSEEKGSSDGWGSWGTWGVSTILSGASTVTNHVTQGLTSVTTAFENGLGALEPEEMARIEAEEKRAMAGTMGAEVSSSEDTEEGTPGACGAIGASATEPSSSGVMGNVLRFMESTGGLIVSSGLNTLETIGKKTMDVLQDGDPGLKRKRALLMGESDKPVLSQVLREARLKASEEDKLKSKSKLSQSWMPHFETLFDDYRGLVHLEALEMLSKTCQMKLNAKLVGLSGPQLIDFQRTIAQVKEQCELPDDDDDDGEDDSEERGSLEMLERDLSAAMRGMLVPVAYTKLIRISEDVDAWLATMKSGNDDDGQNENDMWEDDDDDDTSDDEDPQSGLHEIHQQAIRSLARFTAAVTEHFHKMAELLLLKEQHNSTIEAHCLVMMTTALCSRISAVAARFSELLSATANINAIGVGSLPVDHNHVNSLITNVFLEASNSSSYIQDASNLLVPVLQVGAVQ